MKASNNDVDGDGIVDQRGVKPKGKTRNQKKDILYEVLLEMEAGVLLNITTITQFMKDNEKFKDRLDEFAQLDRTNVRKRLYKQFGA